MPFQKGHKIATGRPKGSENKEKKELRKFIIDFLNEDKAKLKKEIKSLKGEKYIDRIIQLLEYGLGKANRVDITSDDEAINFSGISDAELEHKLGEIIKVVSSREG